MYDYIAVNTFFGLHLLCFISNEQIWLHGNEKQKKVFTLLMHLLSVCAGWTIDRKFLNWGQVLRSWRTIALIDVRPEIPEIAHIGHFTTKDTTNILYVTYE